MVVGGEKDSQRSQPAAFSNLDTNLDILSRLKVPLKIPVVARPKAWVYGRPLAGIAGSNAAGGGHGSLYLVSVVCFQLEVSASS